MVDVAVLSVVDSTIEDPADDVRRSTAPVGKYEVAASDGCAENLMVLMKMVIKLFRGVEVNIGMLSPGGVYVQRSNVIGRYMNKLVDKKEINRRNVE